MPAHLRPIPVKIPAVWDPEQALAVLDLLDDLRQAISTRYGSQVQLLPQELQTPAVCQDDNGSTDDPSF
jgi:hypothetical protein